jgi:hypothetical protein
MGLYLKPATCRRQLKNAAWISIGMTRDLATGVFALFEEAFPTLVGRPGRPHHPDNHMLRYARLLENVA